MSRMICKYEVSSEVAMPVGAKILSVQLQGGRIMLWAEADPAAVEEVRQFATLGTGWSIDPEDSHQYLATVQTKQGLVWHIYEINPKEADQ